MAVYNRIGGGMNRVTLNGKTPTERINLTKKRVQVAEIDECPTYSGIDHFKKIKIGDIYYLFIVYKNSNYQMSFLKGNLNIGWTEISLPKFNRDITVQPLVTFREFEGEIYISVSRFSIFYAEIYKYNIEKNEFTLIFNLSNINIMDFHKYKDTYFVYGDNTGVGYSILTTKDFRSFTEIQRNLCKKIGLEHGTMNQRFHINFLVDNKLYLIGNPGANGNDSLILNLETITLEKGYKLPTKKNIIYMFADRYNAKEEIYTATIKETISGEPKENKIEIYRFDKNGFEMVEEIRSAYKIEHGLINYSKKEDTIFLELIKGIAVVIKNIYERKEK